MYVYSCDRNDCDKVKIIIDQIKYVGGLNVFTPTGLANAVPMTDLAGVFHPLNAFDLKSNLTNTFVGRDTELSNEAMRSGFVGNIAGIQIFESSNVSVDGSDDSIGGVFSQDALALAMMQELKLETQRDAA